jgi:hypothetical protein
LPSERDTAALQRGKIYQKDIGPFAGMEADDPDDSWSEVED